MLSTGQYLKCFFTLLLIFLALNLSFSQSKDSLTIKGDTANIYFEKVVLDNKVAYRNKKTNEFLTELEYISISDKMARGDFSDEDHNEENYSDDHWLSNKVNPYGSVNLPTPFKIAFNQTTFTHPIDGEIKITSRFGRRRRGPHRGLDIDLVTGDKVRSVLPGKVRFVGYSRGHGKTVVVRHANEIETVYAHLSAYTVKVDDVISEGQIIGLGGNTGNSRGSHLHLEVRYKGVCIHPEYVFNFDGSETIRGDDLWVSNSWKTPRFHSSYRESELTPLVTKEEAIAAEKIEPRYHRVRKGDTLSHIAERYHLRVKDICRINTIGRNSTLRIGQIIQVR